MKDAKIPADIKKYFWDTDIKVGDIKKYPEYIISRILEYGDEKAAAWMFKNFSRPRIQKTFLKRRGFSPRSANFWKLFFNITKKELCLKRSCKKTQKEIWPY